MKTAQETVKIGNEVKITAKEFFGTQYKTTQLYDAKKIAELKEKTIENAKKRNNAVKFFFADGIEFFSYTITNEKKLTTLNQVQDGGMLSGGELWKFGYVEKNGKITMLCGNHYIADGREDAIGKFQIVKGYVEKHIGKEATAFATKN